MSEVAFNLIDGERSIQTHIHGSDGDRIVAALAADPTTLEELDVALGRYRARRPDQSFLKHWRSGVTHEPYDAGIVSVDLVARVVGYESTYSHPLHTGEVRWDDPQHSGDDIYLAYHLDDDWLMIDNIDQFEYRAQSRRAALQQQTPLDVRAIMYDKLPEFIIAQLSEHHATLRQLNEAGILALVRQIHTDWLMQPRDDLAGRCLRSRIIDHRRNHVNMDLQFQQFRWSILRSPPPGVARSSHAYKYGGFSTHELVLYYDLVRELLDCACDHFIKQSAAAIDPVAEIERLQKHQQQWLNQPNGEYMGRTPAAIIDRARRRVPEAMSAHEVLHDDCAICQAMAEDEDMFGSGFWGLDGCNMDDEFVFSFHPTREEWDEEQREREEWNRKWEAEQAARKSDDPPPKTKPTCSEMPPTR
jgi:hypothetical protein